MLLERQGKPETGEGRFGAWLHDEYETVFDDCRAVSFHPGPRSGRARTTGWLLLTSLAVYFGADSGADPSIQIAGSAISEVRVKRCLLPWRRTVLVMANDRQYGFRCAARLARQIQLLRGAAYLGVVRRYQPPWY